jgi:hypothetical protein
MRCSVSLPWRWPSARSSTADLPNQLFPTGIRATAVGLLHGHEGVGAAIGTFATPWALSNLGISGHVDRRRDCRRGAAGELLHGTRNSGQEPARADAPRVRQGLVGPAHPITPDWHEEADLDPATLNFGWTDHPADHLVVHQESEQQQDREEVPALMGHISWLGCLVAVCGRERGQSMRCRGRPPPCSGWRGGGCACSATSRS